MKYRILRGKVNMKHPWKEVDWEISCDYEGESIDGVPHGLGRISLTQSQTPSLNFSGFGHFTNGVLDGPAQIHLNGGFVFSGTYSQGKWEGIGRSFGPNGVIYYNGHFKNWSWHGQGTM